MKHKNVVTLTVSFTGSYTEDEPTSPWQKNLILQKLCWTSQGSQKWAAATKNHHLLG